MDLLAYWGFPKGRRAQLDFIPADVTTFRAVARRAKLKFVGPKAGFLIEGDDRPGALAEILSTLARAKINVTACGAVAAGEGRYGAILWVKAQDVQRAAKVLGAVTDQRPKGLEVGAAASPLTPAGNQ